MRLFVLLFYVFGIVCIYAQAPLGINYQAVIRNSNGSLITNSTISYKLEIRKQNVSGQIVYAEKHTAQTNAQGLINLIIGAGSVIQGGFSSINWGTGPFFLVNYVDFSGGNNYQNYGSQQLMSVPYALYANTAGSAINKWLYGASSPSNLTGTNGDYYLNVSNGSVYFNNNGTWNVIGNITGPQGNTGLQGSIGVTGNGISSVVQNSDSSLTFYFSDGSTFTTSTLLGPQGPIGNTGANGFSTLVKSSNESPGINCLTGGIKIEFGIDANNNFILDLVEINPSLTTYVCNGITGSTGATGPQGPAGIAGGQGIQGDIGPMGMQGPVGATGAPGINGLNSLIKTTSESPGINCTNGGIKIEYGLDNNNNSTLDANEINSSLTKYVCNGATGTQGIQGIQGITGPQGPAGPAGSSAGTVLYIYDGQTCPVGWTKQEINVAIFGGSAVDACWTTNPCMVMYIYNDQSCPSGWTPVNINVAIINGNTTPVDACIKCN